jgi:hypothetical protein
VTLGGLRAGLAHVLLAAAAAFSAAQAQGRPVVVRDAGPGRAGRIVVQVLAAPHELFGSGVADVALRRDTLYASSVVALAQNVTVAATVRGDVVVIGGDLFLRPGAVVEGRAVAVGGSVYGSTLAVVRGGRESFRDYGFAVSEVRDTLVLRYHPLLSTHGEPLYLPGFHGLGVPSYDRVNGAALPWGPALSLDTGRIEIGPTITYRSHVGAFDPAVSATLGVSRRTTVTAWAGRSTFSNDVWIRPDALNSAGAFVLAADTRNYYRADAARLSVARLWARDGLEVEPFVGALTEFAWSTGPHTTEASTSTPYSVINERDSLGMLRPNPLVRRGRISSAVGGVRLAAESPDVSAGLVATEEVPFRAPDDARFAQTTLDGNVSFDAFLNHRFEFFAHAVITAGDDAPPQRFGYLGGRGTLITLPLLAFGGDELLYVESRYTVPLNRLAIPVVGAPTVAIRYLAGGAGAGWPPPLVQNLGLRLTISAVRVDFAVDPSSRETEFDVSLAFFR